MLSGTWEDETIDSFLRSADAKNSREQKLLSSYDETPGLAARASLSDAYDGYIPGNEPNLERLPLGACPSSG